MWRKPRQVFDLIKQAGPTVMRIRRGREQESFHSLGTNRKHDSRARSPATGWWRRAFEFAEIRSIKNTVQGATVNDVMLTPGRRRPAGATWTARENCPPAAWSPVAR